jgi:hypothetical protein
MWFEPVCIAVLVAALVRVVLIAGPGGGNARRAVNRQLRRNQTVLGRPPRGWLRVVVVAGVGALVVAGVVAALWLAAVKLP